MTQFISEGCLCVNKMDIYYNIHNLIKVKVSSNYKYLQEGYRHYLRYFETRQEFPVVDYEVREFGDFSKTDRSVSFKREKYAVVYDNNKIIEYTTYANRATNFWIQNLLFKNGMSFIHAAAVEIGGKGIIFPASGGAGKTTLISYLRNLSNFKFFGDDFVIVNKRGEMFSYPSDFSIYKYHVKLFPELRNTSYERFLWRKKYFPWYYWAKRVINFLAKHINISSGPFLTDCNA